MVVSPFATYEHHNRMGPLVLIMAVESMRGNQSRIGIRDAVTGLCNKVGTRGDLSRGRQLVRSGHAVLGHGRDVIRGSDTIWVFKRELEKILIHIF